LLCLFFVLVRLDVEQAEAKLRSSLVEAKSANYQ